MQKNNLCPISNKILTYEDSDSFSQSNFNENKLPFGPSKKQAEKIKQKYFSNISTKINQIDSNNKININKDIPKKFHFNIYNNKIDQRKSLYKIYKDKYKFIKTKYKKSFELNYYIYTINYFFRKYNKTNNNQNNEFLEQFFFYSDSIQIIPKKEFYFYHHMLFLERPNFIDNYFNHVKKNMCLKKLDIYQNQRKKEYKSGQINNNNNCNNNIEIENENKNKKIFDTNVLETIENYSTTMTQEPNNEKQKH